MDSSSIITTFNSPLEAGVRAVNILVQAYPNSYDLQRLVVFDHLIVHTKDIGGPESLHPQLPLRTTEILVRRKLIENGLLLMMSRNLVERVVSNVGITYKAGEMAQTFLNSLVAPYLKALKERALWVVETFGNLDDETLRQTTRRFFDQWIEEFQSSQKSMGA